MVKAVLERGSKVNIKGQAGASALVIAAETGKPETLDLLLSHGVDVNAQDENGNTAFHGAARAGNWDTFVFLMDKSAHIDPRNNQGETPLMLSASRGHLDITKALLSKGADVNAQNNRGWTVFKYSWDSGDSALVKDIVKRVKKVSLNGTVKKIWCWFRVGGGDQGVIVELNEYPGKSIKLYVRLGTAVIKVPDYYKMKYKKGSRASFTCIKEDNQDYQAFQYE